MATTNDRLLMSISARDEASSTLSGIKDKIVGIGAAYLGWRVVKDVVRESINSFADYQANLVSLDYLIKTTGRNAGAVYSAMQNQLGGLASKASIAEGFLKGLTTTLDPGQIGQMTSAIRDASVAMGEDFNVQLPLIIKAIKQLNPAILDNIGVTVRLDQVNQRIRDGYYGFNTQVNEATQQHAIFVEIMKQTEKFAGAEANMLDTTKGAMQRLDTAVSDLKVSFGELIDPAMKESTEALVDITGKVQILFDTFERLTNEGEGLSLFIAKITGLGVAIETVANIIPNALKPLIMAPIAIAKAVGDEVEETFSILDMANKLAGSLANTQTEGTEEVIEVEERFVGAVEQLNINRELACRLYDVYKTMVLTGGDEITDMINERAEEETEYYFQVSQMQQTYMNEGVRELNYLASQARLTTQHLDAAMGSFSGRFSSAMADLATGSRINFMKMHKDFMRYFIEAAIKDMLKIFVPKFLSILGGLFDNPRNDRMAATQGADFMRHFTSGAMNELQKQDFGQRINDGVAGELMTGRLNVRFY